MQPTIISTDIANRPHTLFFDRITRECAEMILADPAEMARLVHHAVRCGNQDPIEVLIFYRGDELMMLKHMNPESWTEIGDTMLGALFIDEINLKSPSESEQNVAELVGLLLVAALLDDDIMSIDLPRNDFGRPRAQRWEPELGEQQMIERLLDDINNGLDRCSNPFCPGCGLNQLIAAVKLDRAEKLPPHLEEHREVAMMIIMVANAQMRPMTPLHLFGDVLVTTDRMRRAGAARA